ncbi:MAG: hypothetical protein GEV11_01005 [Streptosporangiales bacterium]|nr:hypothetical protein [Streptosporangiales bacterium]
MARRWVRWARGLWPAGLLASALLAAAIPPAQAAPTPTPTPTPEADDGRTAFRIEDPEITESSGLAVSRIHPGIVYTHNDSLGAPRVFAVGRDGETKATYTIAGAEARDWEGIALGKDGDGNPALFIGDIGDNLEGAWPTVYVYRVPEPRELRDQTLRATRYRFKYADGPRNAEALLINPRTNRLYVVSKEFAGGLYAAPRRLRTSRTNVLKRIANVPIWITDGAYAPDGSTFVLRTYYSAIVYRPPAKRITEFGLPDQQQGESIAYARDGRSLLVGSEGADSPVLRIPLPPKALPSPTPSTPGATRETGSAAEGSGFPLGPVILGIVAFIAVVIVAIIAVARRHH